MKINKKTSAQDSDSEGSISSSPQNETISVAAIAETTQSPNPHSMPCCIKGCSRFGTRLLGSLRSSYDLKDSHSGRVCEGHYRRDLRRFKSKEKQHKMTRHVEEGKDVQHLLQSPPRQEAAVTVGLHSATYPPQSQQHIPIPMSKHSFTAPSASTGPSWQQTQPSYSNNNNEDKDLPMECDEEPHSQQYDAQQQQQRYPNVIPIPTQYYGPQSYAAYPSQYQMQSSSYPPFQSAFGPYASQYTYGNIPNGAAVRQERIPTAAAYGYPSHSSTGPIPIPTSFGGRMAGHQQQQQYPQPMAPMTSAQQQQLPMTHSHVLGRRTRPRVDSLPPIKHLDITKARIAQEEMITPETPAETKRQFQAFCENVLKAASVI